MAVLPEETSDTQVSLAGNAGASIDTPIDTPHAQSSLSHRITDHISQGLSKTSEDPALVWHKAKEQLRREVPSDFYDRAILPTAGGRWEEGMLVILTPEFLTPLFENSEPISHALYLGDRLTKPAERILFGTLNRSVRVRFEAKP